ncbi:hypothetical protein PoB_000415900 [Plakobranchus ocellatus]|uniref:Uncharacterized protein n=1 Tax=Plakobranchus ocellatus TaxID=259542 RepID=A0AAV3Y3U7_9GAST|nr:hypothetical protein PoB_000415900 [Plakobranchus ocellatus]
MSVPDKAPCEEIWDAVIFCSRAKASPPATEPSLEGKFTALQWCAMATSEVYVSSKIHRTPAGIGLSSFLRK